MALQHLRSSTAHKRPIPTVMSAGQIAINTNEASPGLFFKDSNGDLVKVGPVHIGTTAPNASPASVAATALVTGTVYQILTVGTTDFTLVGASANTVGTIFTATGTTTGTGTVSGQQGVEKGEQWLDTTGGTYVLKIYDGTAWRSESGTFLDSAGDTMTGALLLDNAASAAAPDLSFDGDADTGIYSPNANTVAISTAGTARALIDSNGNVGIGVSSITNIANRSQLVVGGTNGGLIDLSHGSTAAEGRIFVNDGELALLAAESDGEIKFQTGGANERFRIDNSGRLLAGTSSARTDLIAGTRGGRVQVEAASSTTADAIDNSSLCLTMGHSGSTGSANIFFTRTKSDSLGGVTSVNNNNTLGGLYFQGTDGTDAVSAALIKAEVDGVPGANDMPGRLVFSTTADGASSPTERMRIDSSGNVGIGTTSAANLLHVQGDVTFDQNAGGQFAIRGSTNTSNRFNFGFDTTSNYAWLQAITAGTAYRPIALNPAGGDVGVGTASPEKAFHAEDSAQTVALIKSTNTLALCAFQDAGTSSNSTVQIGSVGDALYLRSGGSESARIDSSGSLNIKGAGTAGVTQAVHFNGSAPVNSLVVNSSGLVGIGTTSPAAKLHINNSGFASVIVQSGRTTTNENIGSILFRDGGANNASEILSQVGGNLLFKTAGTEKVRIDSSGRLLVGATSTIDVSSVAPAKLQVTHAATNISAAFYSTVDAGGPAGVLALGHGRGSVTGLLSNNDVMGQIRFAGADGTDLESIGAQISAEVDGTPGANDMPGRLVFSTTADGASTPTEHFRIANNGDLTATDTTIGSNSDSRLKTNVADFTYDLEDFKQYQPKTFDWKNPELHGNKTGQRGFIAQDVEAIDSYWVDEQAVDEGSADAEFLDADLLAKTLKLGKKDAMYVSVIQQLLAKVETLEAKVAALEAGN